MSDDFLSRWSRRKTSAKKSQSLVDEEHDHGSPTSVARLQTDASVPQRSDKQDAGEGPNPEAPEALAAQHPELPDVETLGEGSDYKAFMKDGIPGELQSAALRKLWRTNPAYRVLDGLNDYDDDFRALHALAGAVKTVYQVGKGMPAPEKKPDDELPDELAEAGADDLAPDAQSKDDEVAKRDESADQDDREHSESDGSENAEVAATAEEQKETPEAEPANGEPNAASAENKVTGFGQDLNAIEQE
ncbi:MAG: DUF3306 domain-containing protein, partial [Pseudomonadota bacterium]